MKRKKIASICLGALLVIGLGACDNFSFGSTSRNNVPPAFEADEDDDDNGGEEELQIDKRVSLTSGSVYFDGSDVPFTNEADLTSSASADVGGNVTYTLSGTASAMSTSQANEFYKDVAAAGDTYIVATVTIKEDETLSWYSADDPSKQNTLTYEQCNGSEDFIIRISGVTPEGEELKGDPFTFTIASDEVVSHTLDFSGVSKIPARIALGTGTLGSSTYVNDASLSIASKVVDASGNITYTLSGKAGEMTEQQATDFWSGVAAAGNKFIVVTVSLNVGESVSANSSTPIKYEDCGGEENYIVRLTGTSTSGNTSITFTITDSNSGTINHVIDFSALLDASDNAGDEE